MPNEDFIVTKDPNEVAKIHSNPQYANWRYEFVDGEYRFYSPNYEKRKAETYVTLEQLEPLLSESGYMCFGHGTGRKGNSDEVVDSIFSEGLRTKNNSLYYTTIGLSTPTPENKALHKEIGISEPTLEDLIKLYIINLWKKMLLKDNKVKNK